MIDQKYAVNYKFPHTLVHIVDNSAYDGPLPLVVADDPSLYATIVVTAAPMGKDNSVVTINRSDVANVAYGLSSVNASDVEKFGQTITYPLGHLDQGAPVRFLRVTPEGSTYGVSCIFVDWYIDPATKVMHVRFVNADLSNAPIEFDKFKNVARLNAAIINNYSTESARKVVEGDIVWDRRVFMTNISAGRGSAYNYMLNTIDLATQPKRPGNIAYNFATVDSRSTKVIERFVASLINTNDASVVPNVVESCNSVVGRRVDGSSVIIPTINEAAVKEVFTAYMDNLDYVIENYSSLDVTDATETFCKNVYSVMNVNLFDMIYGRYLYNVASDDIKLPMYQVDSINTSVPRLSDNNIIETTNPVMVVPLRQKIVNENTFGIKEGSSMKIGDLYLSTITSSSTSYRFYLIATINQYTGSVTTLTASRLFPLGNSGIDKTAQSKPIKFAYTDASEFNAKVNSGYLVEGDIVVQFTTGTAGAQYKVQIVTSSGTAQDYTINNIYDALDFGAGAGNVVGRDSTSDAAWGRPGALNYKASDSTNWIYVVDYDGSTKITLTPSLVIGTPQSTVTTESDLVNDEFDVCRYESTNYRITSNEVDDGGEGYTASSTVKLRLVSGSVKGKTIYEATVNADGEIEGSLVPVTDPIETDEAFATSGTFDTELVDTEATGSGCTITIVVEPTFDGLTPAEIKRFMITGALGSLFRIQEENIYVPANYYSDSYGINLSAEAGGVKIALGSTGFFDSLDMNSIEFKWRYSNLLVRAYKGLIDPRLLSPTRCPAKYLFDGGTNTVYGQTVLTGLTYTPTDIVNASSIFTEDEKDALLYDPSIADSLVYYEEGVDVKQAMYDFMIHRVYQGIPEQRRPVGPGSGLSLHLDSGTADIATAKLINASFNKRFDNPNCSWDIGGYVSSADGVSYTYTKWLSDHLIAHCKSAGINKPFAGSRYAVIPSDQFVSFFPDIDATDWDINELMYTSGGNAWVMDINGRLFRRSQRTMKRDNDTSDLIQESNMRTLSQLVYLLQNKLDSYLIEYNDDGVLQTIKDEVNNMFSGWVGKNVQSLDIEFYRDVNTDGGDIVVCEVNVTFRGLILRVPIIVNVNRRMT